MLIEISDVYDDGDRWVKVLGVKLPWPFPVAYFLGSSSAKVFGRAVYSGKKRPRPVTWALFKVFRSIREVKYWFMYRFVKDHQYNVIHTDLKPGYYDIDTIMLHGVMTLVCRFIEDEQGGRDKFLERIGWLEDDSQHREVDLEMIKQGRYATLDKQVLEIYDWWKTGRFVDMNRRKELVDKLFGDRRRSRFEDAGNGLSKFVMKPFDAEEQKEYDEMKMLDDKIDADETKYLRLAVELRGGMWT